MFGILSAMLDVVALQGDVTSIADSINAVWVLMVTFLIFFMQPGFALLEAGQVRAKNAGNVVMKNMTDWSLGVLVYYALGAGIAALAGYVTTPSAQYGAESAYTVAGVFTYITTPTAWIGWLFGAVFAMTAATIVSGAVAERVDDRRAREVLVARADQLPAVARRLQHSVAAPGQPLHHGVDHLPARNHADTVRAVDHPPAAGAHDDDAAGRCVPDA